MSSYGSYCQEIPFTANPILLLFSFQYNDYVHYVEPCFKGILVQADRDNREVSARLRGVVGTALIVVGLVGL